MEEFALDEIGLNVVAWSAPGDEGAPWPTGEPAAAGFDADKLGALRTRLTQPESPMHSVLVVRNGAIVFECYHSGVDERMGEPLGDVSFEADTLHDQRSVTKSIVGATVGIALNDGAIACLDEPLATFFPEYRSGREEVLDTCTVRHALTMTAGLVWDEFSFPYSDPRNDENALWAADDPLEFALSRPQTAPPGEVFGYNGGLPTVLAAVVERAAGTDYATYLTTRMLQPLGITKAEWITHGSGLVVAASGLRLTPRDMARFGQMMLHEGRVGDAQIVPSDYVAASMTAQVQTHSEFMPAEYGYQWWIAAPFPVAVGNGGQRVLVDADHDLVIVTTAGLYDREDQGDAPLQAMAEIFSALSDS